MAVWVAESIMRSMVSALYQLSPRCFVEVCCHMVMIKEGVVGSHASSLLVLIGLNDG